MSIEKRPLANTGMHASRICMGAMTFGGQADEETSEAIFATCIDKGINFFDTANTYTGGRSEEILGRLLQGRRDKVILATKVGLQATAHIDGPRLSRAVIEQNLEASLARLQTDYVDLYYLHAPDPKTPLDESLEALNRLVDQGKIRHPAVSNYAGWQVCHMDWLTRTHNWAPVRITQPMYNLISRGIEQEFLPMCHHFRIATMVYNPLAGGLLTGKHRPGPPTPGTRFELLNYVHRYWHQRNFEAVVRLQDIARTAQRNLIGLAFSWLLHHTMADTIIMGASNQQQLQENLSAVEGGPLPPETLNGCNEVWNWLRGTTPRYNR